MMDSNNRDNELINITLLKKELGESDAIPVTGIRRADEEIYRQADREIMDAITQYQNEFGPRGESKSKILLRVCINFAVRRIIASRHGSEQQREQLNQVNQQLDTWLAKHAS
ncbi:MAG: hypothetical protein K5633_05095 [Paludibacteraceae bacterium]|nr:hypothetical protein [Paludibacteraceae bacterium]